MFSADEPFSAIDITQAEVHIEEYDGDDFDGFEVEVEQAIQSAKASPTGLGNGALVIVNGCSVVVWAYVQLYTGHAFVITLSFRIIWEARPFRVSDHRFGALKCFVTLS